MRAESPSSRKGIAKYSQRPENRLRFTALVLWILLASASAATAAQRKSVPVAPLPSALLSARKAYLLNGQTTSQNLTKNGNALAFDTFYADMKSWGKYEIVGSPQDADIVIELQYRPYSEAGGTYGVYNPSSHTIQTTNTDRIGADFALVFYEAKSKQELWSVSDACGFARLVSNQRKEVIKSIDRLVDGLRSRATP